MWALLGKADDGRLNGRKKTQELREGERQKGGEAIKRGRGQEEEEVQGKGSTLA